MSLISSHITTDGINRNQLLTRKKKICQVSTNLSKRQLHRWKIYSTQTCRMATTGKLNVWHSTKMAKPVAMQKKYRVSPHTGCITMGSFSDQRRSAPISRQFRPQHWKTSAKLSRSKRKKLSLLGDNWPSIS